MSNDTDDIKGGIVDDLTRKSKTRVNIYRFLQKNKKVLYIL